MSGIFSVTASPYGATGNGTTDDTLGIQAALDAAGAGGGCVFFPEGTYLLSLRTEGLLRYCLKVYPRVRLAGADRDRSILKLCAAAGDHYQSILMGADPSTNIAALVTDLSGLEIVDLTIDCNGTNNAITPTSFRPENAGYDSREVLHVQSGNDILVQNCRITDIGDSINTLFLCGENTTSSLQMRNITVRDNIFEGVGRVGNIIDHDHSTIYTSSVGALIADNHLSTSGQSLRGAVAAIETHSLRTQVVRNTIENFIYGIVPTGISAANTVGVEIAHNTIRGVNFGIYIGSSRIADDQAGYGLRDVDIHHNQLEIDRDGWWPYRSPPAGPHGWVAGILLDFTSNLPTRDLSIHHNRIRFLPTSHPFSETDWNDAGICYHRPDTQVVDEDLSICDNEIDGAFADGIYFNATAERVDISRNRVINAGNGVASAQGLDRSLEGL